MKRTVIALIALFMGLSQSCALFKPMTPEERAAYDARMAKYRAEQQAKQGAEDNRGGMELRGKDVLTAIQVAEAIMKENGYTTSAAPYKRGPGNGMGVTGKKVTNRDLASSVGMNVVGNMLGADRGKIVQQKVETTTVWIWEKWNANYTAAQPGALLYANAGETYELTQAGEKVNATALDAASMVSLRDGIQARLK